MGEQWEEGSGREKRTEIGEGGGREMGGSNYCHCVLRIDTQYILLLTGHTSS